MVHVWRKFLLSAVFFFLLSAAAVSQGQEAKLWFDEEDTLEDIRFKIDQNGYDFTVDENWVFNMEKEKKRAFFERKPPRFPRQLTDSTGPGPLLERMRRRQALPAGFDWRNKDGRQYIGPVRNQGDCGSCYSFAAAAVAESAYNIALDNYNSAAADFSESYIAWCLSKIPPYSDHFTGCDGADFDYFELQALTEKGVIAETDFPYQEYDPGTCPFTGEASIKFKSWHRVSCNDVEAIKSAIYNFGVVDAAVMVTSAFQAYNSGIYEDANTLCSGDPCYYTATNHAISLVGWGEENGKEYFILRNSWGPDWGEDGYMRIATTAAGVGCAVSYLVYDAVTPSAKTNAATSVAATSAVLNGSLNPRGSNVSYYFDYGADTKYGQKTATKTASGSLETAVSETLSGLTSDTTYNFRLVVVTDQGSKIFGGNKTFYTISQAGKPIIATGEATSIESDGATLNGVVNPVGSDTTYYFEYGATKNYGLISNPPGEISAAKTEGISVQSAVYKLDAGATYHYRLVAKNSLGESLGADRTFTTEPSGAAATFLQDGSFEAGIPNPYWEDVSTNWEYNMFQGDDELPAHSGEWLVWFSGGDLDAESGRLAQTALFPSGGNASLKFWLMALAWEGETGTFDVKIDDTVIQSYDEADSVDFFDWTEVVLDVSAYADGKTHTLSFEAGMPLDNYTSFLIDDVSLSGGTAMDAMRYDVNRDTKVDLGDVIFLLQLFIGLR